MHTTRQTDKTDTYRERYSDRQTDRLRHRHRLTLTDTPTWTYSSDRTISA